MNDENSKFELDEQEALELLESIKKARERDKQLLTDNAFNYFCLWLSFNKPRSANQVAKRVKVFPFPGSARQP